RPGPGAQCPPGAGVGPHTGGKVTLNAFSRAGPIRLDVAGVKAGEGVAALDDLLDAPGAGRRTPRRSRVHLELMTARLRQRVSREQRVVAGEVDADKHGCRAALRLRREQQQL